MSKGRLLATDLLLQGLQAILFLLFIAFRIITGTATMPEKDIPRPIPAAHIRLAALGEPQLAAKLVTFWLLTADIQAGRWLRLEQINYPNLTGWLQTIQSLDPASDYPGMIASGVFIDVKDPQRARWIIEFVEENFRQLPDRRWRWLVHCTVYAKYRLHDLPLALKLAASLRAYTSPEVLPSWARDMEFILLQELGEHETARQVVQGILRSGEVQEPREQLFLMRRLEELEQAAGIEAVE
ncbi:MAG TPA: hypothetical protein VGL10_06095 [Gammaproteobacteria bacterium]